MVNKVTIKKSKQATLIFGPAQAAVAKVVVDSVVEGVIPKADVENLYLIVSVFLEWDASDKDKVYKYNYEATKLAIKNAYYHEPKIDEILSKKTAHSTHSGKIYIIIAIFHNHPIFPKFSGKFYYLQW